jgi:hypothetical protein
MNDESQAPRKSAELPDDVKAELLKQRDLVDAGEPTVERDKGLNEIKRRIHTPAPR